MPELLWRFRRHAFRSLGPRCPWTASPQNSKCLRQFSSICLALCRNCNAARMASADFCLDIGRLTMSLALVNRMSARRSVSQCGRAAHPRARTSCYALPKASFHLLSSKATRQISQGKARDLPRISAAYTSAHPYVIGLPGVSPCRPWADASYAVRVPRNAGLPSASFPPLLAVLHPFACRVGIQQTDGMPRHQAQLLFG